MKPILIVDDEKPIAELIRMTLAGAGFECETAFSGEEAADLLDEKEYDLVLLDIMMPEVDGFQLIQYISPRKIPVIFVTAKTDVVDRVRGFRLGADDYIVKPFEPLELIARVESVLRRANRGGRVLSAFDVECDPVARKAVQNGREIALTPKEFDLLLLLMRNKGASLYRDYLYESVWGDDELLDTRTLDTHIQRLRRKLDWDTRIKTLYRIGYILEDDQ